eukprot:577700-Amorphochlora_amoeboformis.AAC.1
MLKTPNQTRFGVQNATKRSRVSRMQTCVLPSKHHFDIQLNTLQNLREWSERERMERKRERQD